MSNNSSQLATPEHLGHGALDHTPLNTGKNDYFLDEKYNVHRLSSTSAVSITGFAGGRPGRTVILRNLGGEDITVTRLDELSLLQNRVECPGGTDYTLSGGESVSMVYDDLQAGSGQWVLGV